MATIQSIPFSSYLDIKNSDTEITEYRDFNLSGVPSSPVNLNSYLAKTSGSGFLINRIYLYYANIFYESIPYKGYVFYDPIGNQLLNIDTDGSIDQNQHESFYSNIDMNNNSIIEVNSISTTNNSIPFSPITYSSYALSKINDNINALVLPLGISTITGFSGSVSSVLVGVINSGNYTAISNGIYSISLSASASLLSTIALEIQNQTQSRILASGQSLAISNGCAVNFCGYLSASDVIIFRLNAISLGVTTNIYLSISRIN